MIQTLVFISFFVFGFLTTMITRHFSEHPIIYIRLKKTVKRANMVLFLFVIVISFIEISINILNMIMFFDSWESILRAFIITILGYTALVVAIRISGKRTLSKMNAFDFIVTIALGSCLAATSLNKNIALAEGVVVYSTLIGLQFIITWLSVRVRKVKEIVGGQPVLLLYKGQLLNDVIKKQRITIEEIYASCRKQGITSLNEVDVIVLEATGDITVISKIPLHAQVPETLENVLRYPGRHEPQNNEL